MRTLLTAALLAFAGAGLAQDPRPAVEFKVLLAATDDARGARFKAFLEKNNIACTVVKYAEVTPELLEKHDMLMADTPEGSFKKVGEALRAGDPRRLPKTDKPIFGIATMGYQVIQGYGVALGKIKT